MNRNALVASVSVAVIGFLLLSVYIRRFQREATGGEPVKVLMLRQDVPVGEPLSAEMLAVREMPASYVEDRHVVSKDLHRVLGVKVSLDLRTNQTLLWTDLETKQRDNASLSARIPSGMRAMAIPGQQSNEFSGLLRPGNRVDVLLTKIKPGTEARFVTVPLLQNLLVLAVGDNVRNTHEASPVARSGAVTVLVTVDQAGLLAQAQRDGTLRLVLRNENDVEINLGLRETDDTDVLEQEKRARLQRPRRIERVN